MPYCCQCGQPTSDQDRFCAHCGAPQPPPPPPPSAGGISPRTASILSYIPMIGWIAAILILASQRFRHDLDVRFHAFQGLYLFVAWLLVDWVIAPLTSMSFMPQARVAFFNPGSLLGNLLKLVIFGCWIFMILKAAEGVRFKLPLLGDLAEKSIAEQP